MTSIDETTQQNAALVEEAAAAAESMLEQVHTLVESVNQFKINAQATTIGTAWFTIKLCFDYITFKIIWNSAHRTIDDSWVDVPAQAYPAGFLIHANSGMIAQVNWISTYIHQWEVVSKILTENVNHIRCTDGFKALHFWLARTSRKCHGIFRKNAKGKEVNSQYKRQALFETLSWFRCTIDSAFSLSKSLRTLPSRTRTLGASLGPQSSWKIDLGCS